MKQTTFLSTLVLAAVHAVSATAITPRGSTSPSWAGTSCYFLQGLSDADQDAYLSQLSQDGVKVLRVWVAGQPGGGACVKGSVSVSSAPEFETTLGQYNWETLDLLDKTLVAMSKHGIKALVSPHDANLLQGANGNDAYGARYGNGYFYEQQDAINIYDNRLRAIVGYTGKYSGRAWSTWHEAIMGFDIENEPYAPKPSECTANNDAPAWPCGRAATLRAALGADNPIKIATGGLGGDITRGCTFMSAAVQCPEMDMIAVHRYAGPEYDNQNQWTNSYNGWLGGEAGGKLVYVEEWGVDTTKYDVKEEFPANTRDMNAGGVPWLYWQILPEQKCQSRDSDPFGFYINSGVDVADAVKGASSATSKQDWYGIIY